MISSVRPSMESLRDGQSVFAIYVRAVAFVIPSRSSNHIIRALNYTNVGEMSFDRCMVEKRLVRVQLVRQLPYDGQMRLTLRMDLKYKNNMNIIGYLDKIYQFKYVQIPTTGALNLCPSTRKLSWKISWLMIKSK